MTNWARHIICLAAAGSLLSSCAYMQTHKNIEEAYRTHKGYELTNKLELYRAGGQYYLAAKQQWLRRHYPTIHDTVFLTGNNDPSYTPANQETLKVYHPISTGTAQVLQNSQGYAEISVLTDELNSSAGSWQTELPAGATACTIKAEIAGTSHTWLAGEEASSIPLTGTLLSTADKVIIDWPGTLLYNISIPIMAPFVFFHEFLNEQ